MSIVVQKLSLTDICSNTLAQCFELTQAPTGESSYFQLTDTDLFIDTALDFKLNSNRANVDAHQATLIDSNITLVVFDSITLTELAKLTKTCEITPQSIRAINHRNKLTSYRLNVVVNDIDKARQALASFSLANNIEAALLENTPSLSTPGLLVMDMDSTTIEIECIDEIATLAGVGKQVAEVTELAMQGKLDFAQSLHQRVATLADAPESILASVAKDIPLMPGLETLISELKKHNWRIAIASGGFTYFSEHLQKLLALDATFANTLEIIDGKLTGKVLGDVVDAQAKADTLAILSERFSIPKTQTVAMGDGANDLVMMSAASLGVAYHAKPIVLEQAETCINHSGLDCLLHWLA